MLNPETDESKINRATERTEKHPSRSIKLGQLIMSHHSTNESGHAVNEMISYMQTLIKAYICASSNFKVPPSSINGWQKKRKNQRKKHEVANGGALQQACQIRAKQKSKYNIIYAKKVIYL